MTNWVTIKIPEDTRDKAKADSRTYQEIIEAGLGESVEAADTSEVVEQLKNEISMANDPAVEVDTEGLIREIEKLQELVERLPEQTADKFGEKYA